MWTELWTGDDMKRLNAKQLLVLPKGKYHDGNGLYISISSKGKGKWSFRYRAHKKSREMGLGRFPDVSLFDARQYALSNKQLLRKNIDPIDEKNRAEVLRQQQNKKFSEIADLYISTKKKDEWTNPKSEQQWRSTITNYAVPYLDKKPLSDINMDDIHVLLLPIWSSKTETARRLQQRLFRIFGFAKVKKWYGRDNPALWRGGLQEIMPDPYKIQKVTHHPSLPHEKIHRFYEQLCKYDVFSAYALRLLILTASRTSEVIKARFEQFDLKKSYGRSPIKT